MIINLELFFTYTIIGGLWVLAMTGTIYFIIEMIGFIKKEIKEVLKMNPKQIEVQYQGYPVMLYRVKKQDAKFLYDRGYTIFFYWNYEDPSLLKDSRLFHSARKERTQLSFDEVVKVFGSFNRRKSGYICYLVLEVNI